MEDISQNKKLVSVSYLSKVLTPIVTMIKSIEASVLKIIGVPIGGGAGQVLVKQSDTDGDVAWVDVESELTEDIKAYIDEQITLVEPDNIDDGEI